MVRVVWLMWVDRRGGVGPLLWRQLAISILLRGEEKKSEGEGKGADVRVNCDCEAVQVVWLVRVDRRGGVCPLLGKQLSVAIQ